MAVWQSSGQDGGTNGFDGFTGAYGRVFDNAGRPVTREFQVPLRNEQQQFSPKVEVLGDGTFVVAFESEGPDSNGQTDDFHVYFQRFAIAGSEVVRSGAQVQVSTDIRNEDQRIQDLTLTGDGGFRVTWASSLVRTDWTILSRSFDATGAATEAERVLAVDIDTGLAQAFRTLTPGFELLATADRGFWAVNWQRSGQSEVGDVVVLQRYDAQSNLVGPLRRVSTAGDPADNVSPGITQLATGGFAVSWSGGTSTTGRDAFVRTYDAAGNELTGPVRINDRVDGGQGPGEIVPLADGGFLATYSSFVRRERSADLVETLGRRFNAAGQPVSGSIDLSQFLYQDMTSPVAEVLADGSIVFAWSGGALLDRDVFGAVLPRAQLPEAPIFGTPGADVLNGTAADDVFRPGLGNDVVNAGAGFDTVVFDGAAAAYALFRRGDDVLVGARDRSQSDRLTNVEQLRFDGVSIASARLPSVSPTEYLAGNPDLVAAFGTNLTASEAHLRADGLFEGRSGFDGLSYIASYADLRAALGGDEDAGARHFLSFGRSEGRGVLFDPLAYTASYADLADAFKVNPEAAAAHYLTHGAREGRTTTFDALRYIAAYGDLIGVFGFNAPAAIVHYLDSGRSEGRTDRFDAEQYLLNYADLRAAFGGDAVSATRHFIAWGFAEGRTDLPLGGDTAFVG